MEHDYRHLSTKFDMDAWLDATDELVPGNHSANDVPAYRPFVHMLGPSGDMLLRQWPANERPEHVQAMGRVLARLNAEGVDFVPAFKKAENSDDAQIATIKDRHFSALSWLEGRPLGRFGGYVDPDGKPIALPLPESAHADEVIVQVASAMARAHEASIGVDRSGLPVYTLATMLEHTRKYWFEHRKILGDKAADERDIRRWLRCGNRIIPTASDLIRNEPGEFTDSSVILHHDLWPENILITGQGTERQLTGIVGWRHMAAGSAVLDLAQMTIQMQGWSAALTEAIIESYATARQLRPDQRRIVPAVAGLMLVEIVGHLLTLSYVDDRMIGHEATSVLRSGMKTLLDSLERVTHILAPDIDQTERFNRQRQGKTGGYSPRFPARKGAASRDMRGEKNRRKR